MTKDDSQPKSQLLTLIWNQGLDFAHKHFPSEVHKHILLTVLLNHGGPTCWLAWAALSEVELCWVAYKVHYVCVCMCVKTHRNSLVFRETRETSCTKPKCFFHKGKRRVKDKAAHHCFLVKGDWSFSAAIEQKSSLKLIPALVLRMLGTLQKMLAFRYLHSHTEQK